MTPPKRCPCGLIASYAECCGRWHGGLPAPTAEALMRSRYSAFVLANPDYLLATWHPSTRPASLVLEAEIKWLGLEVRSRQSISADQAIVEFVARSRRAGGSAERHHEVSEFVREDGRWLYVDARK